MLHDENVYPDPFTFNPGRFMKDGALNPDVRNPKIAAFGFGRRICPGRFMAFDSVWITVACILAVYNISKVKDRDGQPITPPEAFDCGLIW